MKSEPTMIVKGDHYDDGTPRVALVEGETLTEEAAKVGRLLRAGGPQIKGIPLDVLGRAVAEMKVDEASGEPVAPEADPAAVQLAAREIYAQLPGHVIAQLRALARQHGNNRHARRATAAILRRYFNQKAANAVKFAAKRASEKDAKKTPTEKRDERNPIPRF